MRGEERRVVGNCAFDPFVSGTIAGIETASRKRSSPNIAD
jgi:hypothetical protein